MSRDKVFNWPVPLTPGTLRCRFSGSLQQILEFTLLQIKLISSYVGITFIQTTDIKHSDHES